MTTRLVILGFVAACSAAHSGGSGTDAGGDTTIDANEPPAPDARTYVHGDPAGSMPEFHALLDELEGWGTGTTGGIDGTIFVVDTLADDGPRSLRAALTSSEPLWIVFAVDGVIDLADTIEPTSNKTIDARGHAIQIRAVPSTTGFKIVGQSNLIFTNLVLDDELVAWDQDSEGADGITITNSHYIWIHHCSFARWLDGAIDIRLDTSLPGELSHHISVTWSRFGQVYQALNWTADRISFGHNHCQPIRRRCIQMIAGKGHSYNNVIADWNASSIQNAKDTAELLSQRNMFVPGVFADINSRVNGGKIRNLDHHAFGNVVFLGGSDTIDAQFEAESKSLARIDVCTDTACWNQLRASVEGAAGAH